MSTLSELIQKRLEEIAVLCSSLERTLRTSPEGKLRVSTFRNKARYYQVKENESTQGKYLRKNEQDLAMRLAQKDYDTYVLELLRKEEKVLSKASHFYDNAVQRITAKGKMSGIKTRTARNTAAGSSASQRVREADRDSAVQYYFSGPEELVWSNTMEARRNMISPVVPDTEAFVQEWLSEQYEKKGFHNDDVEYYTRSGIRVRSKTELIIAEMLEARDIPFYYEKPLYLRGLGTIHPDFTVLNKRTREVYYWEHQGMMDDEAYIDKALNKINYYMLNGHFPGIDLILTHETSLKPIKTQILEAVIAVYLE